MECKPCPFCGVHNAYFEKDGRPAPTPIVTHDEKKGIRYIECENCGARGPITDTWLNAHKHWNNRK